MFIYHCYFCSFCSCDIRRFVSRLRAFHPCEKSPVTCGIANCVDRFHSVENFRKHVLYLHREEWANPVSHELMPPSSNIPTETSPLEAASHDAHCVYEAEDPPCVPQVDQYEALMQTVSRQSTVLRLRLRYQHGVPASKANSIANDVSDMLKDFKSSYDSCLSSSLPDAPAKVKLLLQDKLSLDTALHSGGRKEREELQKLGFIEPVEIVYSPASSPTKDCSHYVPVQSTLMNYLSRPDVFASIQRECVANNVLDKMSAGEIMNSHPVLQEDKSAIRLVLYGDEFQVAGNLGAHTKSNSITGIYFSVNNIETKFSSKLLHIHLAMLVKDIHVKKYSRGVVYERLIQDLKQLESEGISIRVDDLEYHFKVVVANFSGDNKALSEIGEFNTCFSSGKVCRKCLIDFKELNCVFSESDCVLRSVDAHDYHVRSVVNDSSLSTVYGVKGLSPFSELKSFHPVTSLVNDIMHDVFEGVMPFTIKALVKGLIKTTGLNMDLIRSTFADFVYGYSDKRPNDTTFPVKFPGKGTSVSGTALEKANLFYLVSLVLGPLVPHGNEYWQLYLKCQEICDIVLAPVIEPGLTAVLTNLVQEFLILWSTLPEPTVGPVKPKMHYLIHYPQLFLMFGPLRHLACMKFEHFHQCFKEEVRHAHNFINPTLTLSSYFQKRRCLEYSCNDLFLTEDILSAQKKLLVGELGMFAEVAMSYFHAGVDAVVLSVQKAKLDCVSLKVGEYSVIDVNHEGVPTFIKACHILKYGEGWAVCGHLTFPTCWNVHYHAYEIDELEHSFDLVCVSSTEIVPMQLLSLYKIAGKSFLNCDICPSKWSSPDSGAAMKIPVRY